MKTGKVQDLDMGLSTEKLAASSCVCSWSGHIPYPPLGGSPPATAQGKRANLLTGLLFAWFLSSPSG